MGIVKNISDFFRSGRTGTPAKVDKYGILSPLMSVSEMMVVVKVYFDNITKNPGVRDLLSGKVRPDGPEQQRAVEAYNLFVKALSPLVQGMEHKAPLSIIPGALKQISSNLNLIEDNFNTLFGSLIDGADETAVRSSSLVVIGYLEMADIFCKWVVRLSEHLTQDIDSITPFWSKELLEDAHVAGEFVSNNLIRWDSHRQGLLNEIKQMQNRGSDVAVRSGDTWMDEFIHDSQFTDTEQHLMTAAMKNPILMFTSGMVQRYQEKITLTTTRRDWLLSKVALTEARVNNVDPSSPEYKRLSKALQHYTSLVTKYEQRLERLRA